jgi:CHASE3 domain sensor protein
MRDMCIDTDPAANRAQKEQMDKGRASLRDNMKALQESSWGNPEKKAMVDEVARSMEAYFRVAYEAMDLAMANRNAEAVRWLRTGAVPASTAFRNDLADLKEFMRDRAEDQMGKNEAASRASMMALALCLAVAVALGLATSALLAAAKR